MRVLAGITIGPIFDTITGATVPAALWFSSIAFSDLTRRLCKGIRQGIPSARICSPYYDMETEAENDGVGVYHDRIIFSAEGDFGALESTLRDIIEKERENTVCIFPEAYQKDKTIREYLKQYLQIHYVLLPEERSAEKNSVLAVSPYLDALELMKTFPRDNGSDPFARLFANDEVRGWNEESRNKAIRQSTLFPRKNERYLVTGGHIRDIGGIAANGKRDDLKRTRYFAVVNADGDGMGKFLQSLTDDDVTLFSKACLDYAQKASDRVFQFGGMPIYAGGDDLLFLAPIYGHGEWEGRSVPDLCEEIRKLFISTVSGAFGNRAGAFAFPTLSFGISVQHKKFPLYEALTEGREQLDYAKKMVSEDDAGSTVKDNIALNLRKHSGQSVSLLVHNPHYELFRKILSSTDDGGDDGKTTSVIYTIETFRPLLIELHKLAKEKTIPNREAFREAWRNLFDNPGQKTSEAYIKGIADAYYDAFIEAEARIFSKADDSEKENTSPIHALGGILRWSRFLEEKAGEAE